MSPDPFGLSPWDTFKPIRGYGIARKPVEAPVPEEAPEPVAVAQDEKSKPSVLLRNPKWEVEKVGFNEETDISVEVELPPDKAHKTKVAFELFANTPKGPERMAKADAHAADGKAVCRIPVHIPAYKDEEGNNLSKVEYYFTAKHSDSELLDASDTPKLVDGTAELLLESHTVPGPHFDTDKSLLHPKHAPELADPQHALSILRAP